MTILIKNNYFATTIVIKKLFFNHLLVQGMHIDLPAVQLGDPLRMRVPGRHKTVRQWSCYSSCTLRRQFQIWRPTGALAAGSAGWADALRGFHFLVAWSGCTGQAFFFCPQNLWHLVSDRKKVVGFEPSQWCAMMMISWNAPSQFHAKTAFETGKSSTFAVHFHQFSIQMLSSQRKPLAACPVHSWPLLARLANVHALDWNYCYMMLWFLFDECICNYVIIYIYNYMLKNI